jgi:uncharacterized protein YciI
MSDPGNLSDRWGIVAEARRESGGKMSVFAVTTAKGPNWEPVRGIREQPGWHEHAAFADGLVKQGFIILGGPIGSDNDEDVALMAVEAANETELRSVLGADPWAANGVLRVKEVRPWTVWLDSRSRSQVG